MIGYASGESEEEAFDKLLKENAYLKNIGFNEVICYEINPNTRKMFYISDNVNKIKHIKSL